MSISSELTVHHANRLKQLCENKQNSCANLPPNHAQVTFSPGDVIMRQGDIGIGGRDDKNYSHLPVAVHLHLSPGLLSYSNSIDIVGQSRFIFQPREEGARRLDFFSAQ